jgi:large subunit ribosomal protein L23
MAAPHYQIIRRPIITEKGLGVKETQHTVVFEVAAAATKTEIKEAVQQIFKVKVTDVRTSNFHGKMRRRGQSEGYRRDWKKAYVKLAKDQKMIEYAENL